MEQELKQYLESMETRMETRLETRMDAMETRMDVMESRLRSHVDVRIEKVETNLLGAFHGWARGMEIRVR